MSETKPITKAQQSVIDELTEGSLLYRRSFQAHGTLMRGDPDRPKYVLTRRVNERTMDALIEAGIIQLGIKQIGRQFFVLAKKDEQ
jgi:hypothetical protein